MLAQLKYPLFSLVVLALCDSCTVIDKFPVNSVSAKPPVSSVSEGPANSTDDVSTGQLAAMHDSSKVDVAWVFQYYRLISTIPTKVLLDEYERTKKEFSTGKTPWNQWQMAMLLSLPSASFYDPGRSSLLFKELSDTTSDQGPVIKDAAFLLYSWVKGQHQASKREAELEAQLAESRSANKTLEDQLEALKAIEENLYQRNKVEVAPKP